MIQEVVDLGQGNRWGDAFPWLRSADSVLGVDQGDEAVWWQQPIAPKGTADRRHRVGQLCRLALARLPRWTVGQLFPWLSPDVVLKDLELPARAKNVLALHDYQLAGDLIDEDLRSLLAIHGAGIGTVDLILQALADEATTSQTSTPSSSQDSAQASLHPPVPPPDDDGVRSWPDSVPRDLEMIASWYVSLGMADHPVLGAALPFGAPRAVVEAQQRLNALAAHRMLLPRQSELDAGALLQRAITNFSDRVQEILARRFFSDAPETLEQIARSLLITRERTRQLEARARTELANLLESGGPLALLAETVRNLIGYVLPLTDLMALAPALGGPVAAVRQPGWRVLDRLDDSYEIRDGWCASRSLLTARADTLTRLQDLATDYGVVRLDDIPPLNPVQDAARGRDTLRQWLTYCGLFLYGDSVLLRTQSVGDRAAAILSVVGSPMDSDQILKNLGVERSLGSLKNAMARDDRFQRVDRDRWALTEWGHDAYAGVRALIREEVARRGGAIALDTLVDAITSKYSVSATSVTAYASAPPFGVHAGIVRLEPSNRQARKTPMRTRRLYRRSGEWLYRVRLTQDHLRGSGFVAPMAIATLLNLSRGSSKLLVSRLGPQVVSWTGTQPSFGSIRRFLADEDVPIGSDLFLVLRDDGVFDAEVPTSTDGDPMDRALALVGVSPSDDRPPTVALSAAIGLPENSTLSGLIGAYRDRGDEDIAELLTSAVTRYGDQGSTDQSDVALLH